MYSIDFQELMPVAEYWIGCVLISLGVVFTIFGLVARSKNKAFEKKLKQEQD